MFFLFFFCFPLTHVHVSAASVSHMLCAAPAVRHLNCLSVRTTMELSLQRTFCLGNRGKKREKKDVVLSFQTVRLDYVSAA